MPRGKKRVGKKKAGGRRRYRKKRTLFSKFHIPRPIYDQFKPEMTIWMKYNEQQMVQCPAYGVPTYQQWRINSTFDPDYTFTGHQAYMRDQMVLNYNYYKVIKVRVKSIIIGLDQNAIAYQQCFYTNIGAGGLPALTNDGYSFACERAGGKNNTTVAGTAKNIIKKTLSIPNILNVKMKEYIEAEGQKTPSGSNPSTGTYLTTFIRQANQGNPTTAQCLLQTQFEFLVLWTDRILQPSS